MPFNDRASEGKFVWSDGSAMSFQNWSPGEPNDYDLREDCGTVLYGNFGATEFKGSWTDSSCSSTKKSICRIPGMI